MKLTNIEIINTVNALAPIGEKKIPSKISYAIGKNICTLETLYKPYDKERKKLVDTFVKKDENGKPVTEKTDGIEKYVYTDEKTYTEELQELFDIENEITDIHMVDLKDFEYDNSIYDLLTVTEMKTLVFMIKE
jgi:hypothetical protein